ADPPSPPSLPTRRSSDLARAERTRLRQTIRRRVRDFVDLGVAERQDRRRRCATLALGDAHARLVALRHQRSVEVRTNGGVVGPLDRKSTRLNSSHVKISY